MKFPDELDSIPLAITVSRDYQLVEHWINRVIFADTPMIQMLDTDIVFWGETKGIAYTCEKAILLRCRLARGVELKTWLGFWYSALRHDYEFTAKDLAVIKTLGFYESLKAAGPRPF